MNLNIKLAIIAVIILMVGGMLTFLVIYRDKSDFGDAPMGQLTGYQSGASQGNFSIAKTKAIDQIWLGDQVDGESESRQNNRDKFDDGVSPQFNSCQTSKVYFIVHLSKPGKIKGKAFLNLFVDWNKDGKWGEKDDCASEWAVQNVEIDLSQQTKEIFAYEVEFPGGKYLIDEESLGTLWYRGTISLDEKLTQDDGSAKVASGEIEDYGPMPVIDEENTGGGNDSVYGVACTPEVLYVDHGESDKIEIVPDFGTIKFQDIEWQNHVVPKNANREMEINGTIIQYTGLPVHDLGTVVQDLIEIRVNYPNNEASVLKTCEVWVSHNGTKKLPNLLNLGSGTSTTVSTGTTGTVITTSGQTDDQKTSTAGDTSSGQSSTTPTTSSTSSPTSIAEEPVFSGEYETGTTETTGYLNLMAMPTNMAGQNFYGMQVDLGAQNPTLASPNSVMSNVNLEGWNTTDWACEINGTIVRCHGNKPMIINKKSIVTLYYPLPFNIVGLPDPIIIYILDANGVAKYRVVVHQQ